MLQERVSEDLKTAMKAKEEAKTSILRLLLAALKNKRIDLRRDLTDEDSLAVIRTLVKQYRDALEDFHRGGREDLATKIESEITVLSSYLPAAPSEAEIRAAVESAIAETLGASQKDFGKVMGLAMKKVGSGASGEEVSKIVRALLPAA